MPEEKDQLFRVTDRRKFNPDGTPREQAEDEEPIEAQEFPVESSNAAAAGANVVSFPNEGRKKESESQGESHKSSKVHDRKSSFSEAGTAARASYDAAAGPRPGDMPEPSFLGMVNLLAFQAAMALGLIESPAGAETRVDLEAAREFIDLLGVLEQKTKGNLNEHEAQILESVLADLRMQYVAISGKK